MRINKTRKIKETKIPKKKTKIETKISNKITNYSKIELKNTNILINIGKDQSSHLEIFKSRNKNININNIKNIKNIKNINSLQFYDSELNSLSYRLALIFDKRTYINYYISLIKTKHPLIFSFFPINDFNSKIIKFDLFLLSFSIYYFFNALFFDESTIHKIYEDEGIYNFIYLIPFISYSFFISHTLIIIIKYFSLSERNIYEIKYQKNLENTWDKADKVRKCLIIKYICFFVSGSLILLFFWYYLSSFGAVYKNTQKYLVKNTIISFGFSLLYPFIINLVPSFLRIISIKKSNKEILYKISQILQLI